MSTDSHAVAILTQRLDDSAERLRQSLNSTNAIVVNAAVGDWLDAVYAAMSQRWRADPAAIRQARAVDRDAQIVAGLIHARGRTTKDWVTLTHLTDGYEDVYRDYYGTWCWVPDDRPDDLLVFYAKQIEGLPVSVTVQPAARWLKRWPVP